MLRAALASIALAGLASAQQPVSLYLVETDPPVGSRLQRGEAFYARVQYQTDREIHIWGRGVGTEPTSGKSHPSPVYSPGSGEALIWFTLDVPGKIDVMRIQAVPRGHEAAVAAVDFPVNLRWEDNAPKLPRAAWVEPMVADLQQRVQEHVVSSAGTGWNVFALLLFAATPAYLALQAFAFWRMRGRYGLAFWLPVGAMALVYLVALLGAMAGSNLAPIWVVFASPLALIYVIVLLILDFRRTSHASGAHR
jgi:hypothetical protein